MRKEEVSRLLARYLFMQKEGKETYFDADEIEDLLDSFEDSEDYTLYDGVLSLGIKLHPNHPGLRIKQCKLLVYNEEFTKAMEEIETIAETNEPELDLLRMECYCSLDRYTEAMAYTEQLIASDCEYLTDIFEYTAPILGELGMHTEAIEFIHRGMELFTDNIELKTELCFNLEATGEIKQAITVCNELIDDNPYSFDDWATLGRLYSLESEFDKAIEAFDFALTCDDTDNEVKILKAFCLFMNENYQKAIEVYKEFSEEQEYTFRTKTLMAECYMKLEDYETAYQLLNQVLNKKNAQEEASSYINYLMCCAKTDHLEEEQKTLSTALELFPNHISLLYLKALYYIEENKEDEAIKLLQLILTKIDPTEEHIDGLADTNFQLANLFLKKANYHDALIYFLNVLRMKPLYPSIHLRISICYINLKDSDHFIKHITQCTESEISEFEGNYLPPESEIEKAPLIELIKGYLNDPARKKKK